MNAMTRQTALVLVFTAGALTVRAANWYVDPSVADDSHDGTSSNVVSATIGPKQTLAGLMKATNHPLSGDVIYLMPGEHSGGFMNNNRSRMTVTVPNLTFKSYSGKASDTSIVGSGTAYTGSDAVSCVKLTADATGCVFDHITFKNGSARADGSANDRAGGIWDLSKSCWAIGCVFTNCTAKYGAAMYYGNAIGCEFVDCNNGGSGDGQVLEHMGTVAFSVLHGATTGGRPIDQGGTFVNCTIYGNPGGVFSGTTGIRVYNSISVANKAWGQDNNASKSTGVLSVTNSVFGPGGYIESLDTLSVTNATASQVSFVSAETGDFRLTSRSIAQTAGDASHLALLTLPSGYEIRDLYGNPVRATSGSIPAGCAVEVVESAWYVDGTNGSDANGGRTPDDPLKTIRAATTNAVAGDVVHVAAGTYGEDEGIQRRPGKSTELPARVMVPAGVKVIGAGSANTFIVGRAADDPTADPNGLGNGAGAVRCALLYSGAVLRGFTLTGGHTHHSATASSSDANRTGGAAYTVSSSNYDSTDWGTIEDCMISNNYAHYGAVCYQVLKRCRITMNTASASQAAPGGKLSSFYNCIIDHNLGNGTVTAPLVIDGCTFGEGNDYLTQGGYSSSQVLYAWPKNIPRVYNTLFLYGRRNNVSALTNCVISTASDVWQTDIAAIASNCTVVSAADLTFDADYRPLTAANPVVDRGLGFLSDAKTMEGDVYGRSRVMNGAMDVGAVEYDWGPDYARLLGKGIAVTAADSAVITNALGGVEIPTGEIAGTLLRDGRLELSFDITGTGTLSVSLNGVVVGSYQAGQTQAAFAVDAVGLPWSVCYTPGAAETGSAYLREMTVRKGFVLIFK